ncbi:MULTISPECIES: alpha/beta hydrolase [unclassified Nocardia]|uniref:alpha/beta fold hydrolase n=1 Tax=unclassified Nocardia TaxID=2637762 RepID=UPI0024A8B646|nr:MULTISPECIES: alpha/beta hydrolase [unclassified Nocardia]
MTTDPHAKPSWRTRAVTALLRAGGQRKLLATPEGVHAEIAKRDRRDTEVRPPASLRKRATVTREDLDGWPVYRITPNDVTTDVSVVFLHGGGFFREIVGAHWKFAARLAAAVPAECVVPIYPLVPHGRAAEMVPTTAAILARTIERRGTGSTVAMGNSAGGGLALAAAQALRDRGGPQPSRLVLISPWLDMTMSDPAQAEIEPTDPLHLRPGLAEIGRCYADRLAPEDPRVSPLFGRFEGLPPITAFAGTREIFVTDTRTLARRAAEAHVPIDYHEAPNLPHNYALFPAPEGRAAREIMVAACRAPVPAGRR